MFNKKNTAASSGDGALWRRCADAYRGAPEWATDDVVTINFARTVASEVARLTMLGTKVTISGGARAEVLSRTMERVFPLLRRWVELACAYGTVILKPNGEFVDAILPDCFEVTDTVGGRICGVRFFDVRRDAGGDVWRRIEHHSPLGQGRYEITNECTCGGKPTPLSQSPFWAGLSDRVTVKGLSGPLFAVLTTPSANNIDLASPLGMPIFADALPELRDLDVAYSRFAGEIFESRRTVLLDSDRLLPSGLPLKSGARRFGDAAAEMGLPEYVRIVYGSGDGDIFHEITPSLRTEERLAGINALLHLIGCKCGFSSGYFVPDGRGGVLTATQVEADDRRTIELVRDMRDRLEVCVRELAAALDAFCDLYDGAPAGDFEVVCDFGDITYNRDEDRKRWFEYVREGYVSFEDFLMKFEGMSGEEAKKMAARGAGSEQ